MEIHCDICEVVLGEYFYGPGGVEEKAYIGALRQISLPDVQCKDTESCYRRRREHPEIDIRKEEVKKRRYAHRT